MKPRGLSVVLGAQADVLPRVLAVLALGTATALSAFVRLPLPFSPVPLTLQTLFVLLSGALLGAGGGAAAQVAGLVVLWASPTLLAAAAPGGLFGPTGGYMLAFVPAAWLAGRLAGEGSTLRLVLAMLAATALVYVFGTLQLSLTTGLGLKAALWAGVLPFLPGDALKLAAACGLVRTLRR